VRGWKVLPLVLVLYGSARAEEACAIPEDEHFWTQRALDTWERVSRELLRASPEPLPWIVLVGPRCAWHLTPAPDAASFFKEALALSGGAEVLPGWTFAGNPIAVIAVPHDGRARLPNGMRVAAEEVVAKATLRRQGTGTFLVISTLEVLRRIHVGSESLDVHRLFLGAFSHEVVHTRQLLAARNESKRIAKRYRVSVESDSFVVQRTMMKRKGYTLAYEAERDLLFRAVEELEDSRAKELAAQALILAERRRNQWMRGRRAWLREMESLVLSMEGVAEWCRYRLLADDSTEPRSEAELLALVRSRSWSHEEGLALFLLIDRFQPGWQEVILDGAPRCPFLLLEEALQAGTVETP
jgi:hypothetical protein